MNNENIPINDQVMANPNSKFPVIILSIFLLLVAVFAAVQSVNYFQAEKLLTQAKKETEAVNQSFKYRDSENIFNWVPNPHYIDSLQLAPSIQKTITQEANLIGYNSCLDLNEGRFTLDQIKDSISNELFKTLSTIENYTFTKPIVDGEGNHLAPEKAKYKIEYTNLCDIDPNEEKYVATFFTTEKKPNSFLLNPVSRAQAGGGWTGDSHLVIIEHESVHVYERFPFTAKLINIPKHPNKMPKTLRFAAYYWCGNINYISENHIIIGCSGNVYSFNRKSEKFDELSICGQDMNEKGINENSRTCYDQTGQIYFHATYGTGQ